MKNKIITSIIVFLLLITFWVINFLDNKVEVLQSKVDILKKKEKKLLSQSRMYSVQIYDRTRDIDELNLKLDYIEDMIGFNHISNSSEIQRVDFAKITTKQRINMLQLVPNGSPTKQMKFTSSFGNRKHPITKVRKFHRGLDIKAKRKSKIYATADGVVKYVQSRNHGTFGKRVVVHHNYGFETLYAHLYKTKVKVGDVIYKGDVIALSGNSGRSSGPHLHYEIKFANRYLNPIHLVRLNLKNYDSIFKKEKNVNWKPIINQIKLHEIASNK